MSRYTIPVVVIATIIIMIVSPLPQLLLNNNKLLFAELAILHQSNDKSLVNHSLISQISASNSNSDPTLVKSSSSRAPSSFLIVQRSRGDNSTKSSLVLNVNHTYYTYGTKSEKQTSTPENNPVTSILNKDFDIALIAPTFTAACTIIHFITFTNYMLIRQQEETLQVTLVYYQKR